MRQVAGIAFWLAFMVSCSSLVNTDPLSDDGKESNSSEPADREGTAETGGPCPTSFEACGGDITGTWRITAFCPRDGASLSNPCEHPYSDRPACGGAANRGVCTLRYEGEIRLHPTGAAEVVTSLDSSASFTFDEACLAELGRTGGEDACQGMANERLSCSFNDGLCTCTGVTEPEQETIRTDFVLSGHEVTIGPNLGEPIAGPYCVDGDQLVIQGPTGWAYWVLERVDNV